jgi:predicted nucleic acid-binding protein
MKADVFLTTDDQILRRADQNSALILIAVLNPVEFSTNQNL